MNLLQQLFGEGSFMPHGHCYLWNKNLLGLHITSDTLIALSYFSIPFTLVYFVRKRRDLVFNWIFVCFAVFIVACGLTHVMEIWNIWHPTYWLSGVIKALTALASVPTAILLVRLMPQALALPSPSTLRTVNAELQNEIAEHKRTETKIGQLNHELQQRAAQLEAANAELESFSFSVSHDLRAPLRAADGFSQSVLRDFGPQLPEKGRHQLETIRRSTQHMGQLIDDLLTFSRLSRQPLKKQAVDINALVRTTLNELESQRQGRQIEIKIGSLPSCEGDPGLLKQIWVNLLSNALKYTRKCEQAMVEIGCVREKSENVYFVRDNGAGFDMHYADKLFGVFQRLHLAEDYEGTGVGLAIVRRIAQRHGGRVWAEAAVDRGASFYFTLEGEPIL